MNQGMNDGGYTAENVRKTSAGSSTTPASLWFLREASAGV